MKNPLGSIKLTLLTRSLQNEDSAKRLAAVEELGELGEMEALAQLLAALKDPDMKVRFGAARALDKLKWKPGLDQAGGFYWAAKQVWHRCVAIGQPAIDPLIFALKDASGTLKLEAVNALVKIGAPAVEPLVATLKEIDPSAVGTLIKIGEPAVPPLIAALKSPAENVRLQAATALGEIGDARAVEPLVATLKDKNLFVRLHAAEALEKVGDARAVEPLIAALKDANFRVRDQAASALGKIGDARAVEPLIAALQEKNNCAAAALGSLGDPRAFLPLVAALKVGDLCREAEAALLKIDARDPGPFILALQDSAEDVREQAARVLGKTADDRAVEPLISVLLHDNSGAVRRAAAGALGKIGGERAVVILIKTNNFGDLPDWIKPGTPEVDLLMAKLGDHFKDVRAQAAGALGKIGDGRAVAPLIAALEDRVQVVREKAARALGEIGDARAVEALIAALKDRVWDKAKMADVSVGVRGNAAEALGKIGDARAAEALLIAAMKDPDEGVCQKAARALEKVKQQPGPDQPDAPGTES